MLVTFKCKAYANITMFGDVGEKMLELMGFGKRVPGAIRAEDVAQALQNLRAGLAALPDEVEDTDSAQDKEPATSLKTRAIPLLELLQAAQADKVLVSWE